MWLQFTGGMNGPWDQNVDLRKIGGYGYANLVCALQCSRNSLKRRMLGELENHV